MRSGVDDADSGSFSSFCGVRRKVFEMDRDELAHRKLRKLYPRSARRQLDEVLKGSLFAKGLAIVFPTAAESSGADAPSSILVALAPGCAEVDRFFEERSAIETEVLLAEWTCEASWRAITHDVHPVAEVVLALKGGPPALEVDLLFHVPKVFDELAAAQRLPIWVMHEKEISSLAGPGAQIDLVYDRGVPVREAGEPSQALSQALAHCGG